MDHKPSYDELEQKNNQLEKSMAELKHRDAITQTLLHITNAANRVSNTHDLFNAIHDSLKSIIDVSNFGIALYDDRNDVLKYSYYVDEKNTIDDLNELLRYDQSKSNSCILKVFNSGKPRIVKKNEQLLILMEMPRDLNLEPSESWLGVPLHYNNQVIGIISAQNYSDPDTYTGNDLDTLTALSEQIALSITKRQEEDLLRFNQKQIRTISKESEKRFRIIAETANDAIIIFDRHENIIFWNNTAKVIFGYVTGETMGTLLKTIIIKKDQEILNKEITRILTTDYSEFIGKAVEMTGIKKGNISFPIELSLSTWKTNDEVFFTIIIRDITERKKFEEQILFLAYYDQLTKLPNRTFFFERLSHTIGAAKRYNRKVAVLFLDLDDFKIVNDTLGHEAGDLLLQEVSQRLLKCIRKSDLVARSTTNELVDVVARMGGDEFTICLTEIKQIEDAAIVAKRIIDSLRKPINVFDNELTIGTSIGISVYPSDGDDPLQLLKNADISMYNAKKSGKNNFHFYSITLNNYLAKKVLGEKALHNALENNELFLVYEPVINLQSSGIIGFEALIRWRHPEKGVLTPEKIIPTSEESDLTIPLGNYILKNALLHYKHWEEKGLPALPISLKLSLKQLRSRNFIKNISDYLIKYDVKPENLEFEITENHFIEEGEIILKKLNEIHEIGINISFDDFGVSYCSFNILKDIPVKFLKISPSFIKSFHQNTSDSMIIKGGIAMAHSLNVPIIAKGIETESQLSFLREQKCDAGQGSILSKPLMNEDVELLLQKINDGENPLCL